MGKEDSDIVRLAEQHVFELFRDASTDHSLTYHGFKRSLDLVEFCKDIAKGSKLDGDESQVLLLAAWFHDAGYAVAKDGVAGKSIDLARAFFARHGQPAGLADAVVACLRTAEGEGVHDGLAGKVLHDALLARLVGKNQVKAGELLRFEEERRNGRAYSDVEWTRGRIDRLEKHPYLTRWAQVEYDARSAASLVRLHKQLRKQIDEETDRRAEESKATKSYGRSVESLFGDLTRNQLRMFSIADHRTGTMIHVNAIMISLLVALVLRNIDRHRDLLIPTLVLLFINLTVVVLSIFSLRAGRKSQVRADTRVRDGNLLLATNEARLTLPEYQQGMDQLLSDVPALQRAMVEYLHVTRGFLISRRKTLQLTYDIFICGLAVSLILFMIVIVRR